MYYEDQSCYKVKAIIRPKQYITKDPGELI